MSNTSSCDSVQYSSNGYEFTQVCGRIIGYQFATPDGILAAFLHYNHPDIYVDGVTLTYGVSRQHIWTFYCAQRENRCCNTQYSVVSQVGENYSCDTGNPDNIFNPVNTLFLDPLWDGFAGCSSNDTCCAPHSGPWFYVNLTTPTTDSIEIRICGDQPSYDEDTPLELIEIYVK